MSTDQQPDALPRWDISAKNGCLLFDQTPKGEWVDADDAIAEIERLRAELEALRAREPVEHPVGRMSRATMVLGSGAGYKEVALRFVDLEDAEQIRLWAKMCGAKMAAPQPPRWVERLTDKQIRTALLSGSRAAAIALGVPDDELGEPDEESLRQAVMSARWCEQAMAHAWGVTLRDCISQPAGEESC